MEPHTPVTFQNRQGYRLFGVLDMPAKATTAPTSDLGLILLSPGVKMRVGPERLYRRVTDLFVGLGIPSLRFDFWGLGDSEGTLKEEFLKDVYNHIEVGRFVDDVIDAMDWMQRECGTKRFILSGLCGGAITGLLTGSRDRRVAGLLALGITPTLASSAADPSLYMTSGELAQMRRRYVSKLASPSAWLRLLTLQSDYKVIWRSVTHPFKTARGGQQEASPPPEADNASPLFPPAFFNMLEAQRPMLLIFGGSDRLHWEFEEKFVARHGEKLAALPQVYEVHVIPRANHVLSFEEWQQEMVDVSRRWVMANFARDVKVSAALAVEAAHAQ